MIEDYLIEQIPLRYEQELDSLIAFLLRHHLTYEEDIEVAYGVYDSDHSLHGCGCASGSLLKCFAVDDELRNQNALGSLVSALVQNRFAAGFYDLFIITRTHNEVLFRSCGFFTVVRTNDLVMLENIPNGPQLFTSRLLQPGDAQKTVGAIVMNCNPFTYGHRYLVEQAAAQCDILHIFIVEEDRSLFPTDVRFRLVQEGTADLLNVRVHLSGHYMISSATFPKYFLKTDEDSALLQSELDIKLFAESIAPALHISKRFAGAEPFNPITARYNEVMCRTLPQYGISFSEISRKKQDGAPISASRVRTLLRSPSSFGKALALVPPCTREYLIQKRGDFL